MHRSLLSLLLAVGVAACGDSTVLTGPQAEAAVAAAQAQVEASGEINIRGLAPDDDRPPPVIYLDAKRIPADAADPATILKAIEPSDIDRIEVIKGCVGVGFFGAEGRGGAIFIYTKSYSGADVEKPEYDRDRARAHCDRLAEEREIARKSRWLYDAQQRHVRR